MRRMPKVMENSTSHASSVEVLPRVKKARPLDEALRGVRASRAVATEELLPERSAYSTSPSPKEENA